MGLDMYASTRNTKPATPIDFESGDADGVAELHYWRKHPNLHGWMQKLYVEKGGNPNPGSFNCVPVELTAEDLDRLEKDVTGDSLETTGGFFFGTSTPEDKVDDLEFIMKARGEYVYYDSWW